MFRFCLSATINYINTSSNFFYYNVCATYLYMLYILYIPCIFFIIILT